MSILVKSLYKFFLENDGIEAGALLASVHDENEHKFIKGLIQSHTGQDRPTWLGGKKSVSVFKC